MADDPTNRGPANRLRVNVYEYHEFLYWTKKFGCTEAELREAVRAVGVRADKVEAHLKNKKR